VSLALVIQALGTLLEREPSTDPNIVAWHKGGELSPLALVRARGSVAKWRFHQRRSAGLLLAEPSGAFPVLARGAEVVHAKRGVAKWRAFLTPRDRVAPPAARTWHDDAYAYESQCHNADVWARQSRRGRGRPEVGEHRGATIDRTSSRGASTSRRRANG